MLQTTSSTVSPVLDPNLRRVLAEAGDALASGHGKPLLRGARLPALAVEQVRNAGTRAPAGLRSEQLQWLTENRLLLRSARAEVKDLSRALREYPALPWRDQLRAPRIYFLAQAYLEAAGNSFSEAGITAFVNAYQAHHELEMGEIWALKPALQFTLLERIADDPSKELERKIDSLREINEMSWKAWFDTVSIPDRELARDPAGAYRAMDAESRETYRKAISRIHKHSDLTESQIAIKAVDLASQASREQTTLARRRHVGYYLIDHGVRQLEIAARYRQPLAEQIRRKIERNASAFFLFGVEILTLLTVVFLLSGLDTWTPIAAGLVMLLLPATQAAVDLMNNLVAFLFSPRALPKLDFSEGIPAEFSSMVAVPTLLLNEAQVRNLVLDLEIRFLANRDPNLYFVLVTDSPDSESPSDDRDSLVDLCAGLIEGLNAIYGAGGHRPFLMLHRHRTYNPSEGRWMGWERKRGKLLDLNQLLRGGYDSFPVKVGDTSIFPRIRYVITLDSDTQLPRGSAARLAGAMAHPLNQAVIHPKGQVVTDGYGILQPRIGISVESASRSRLAALYSGQTGFDIYTRAISDVYQDLFGEGIFTGKGIYDVDVFREVLEKRFPENALLSHDLIEGAYARAGLVSDIELIDDYPSHFSAYSRRKHRWVRGDWQILRWLFGRVPDYSGKLVPNPTSLISRWKMLDNLRRSLIEPATLLLLLAGWFYLPGGAKYWTAASMMMFFLPVISNLVFSFLRAPWSSPGLGGWARDLLGNFLKGAAMTVLAIVFLPHQALLSLDAVFRSNLRVFVTRKKLLEWETAAEAESQSRRKSTADTYLDWTPWIAALFGIALWLARPQAVPVAAPFLVLWFCSRGISDWLNRAPRTRHSRLLAEESDYLRESAGQIWRFYKEWSSPATNWLIPDNICEDGRVAQRLSPTNAGLLLNARVAAVHLGLLTVPEFAAESQNTLRTLEALEKYRGHLLNWYDVETLQPLEPFFVSSVDSGNLVACLWTLKQAALDFASQPGRHGGSEKDKAALQEIAVRCEEMVRQMDFTFLYSKRKKVLSVGFDLTRERLEPSTYDLLASESRIASFVAIAKGDVPQESWFHLGRSHTLYRGNRVLISWTGTMFEYLMPALWMHQHVGTITEQSLSGAVRAQQEYARLKGVPWGISESGCASAAGCDYGYAAFGLPALAMKQHDSPKIIISPYSTFLALMFDPKAAVRNLRSMAEKGWTGRYGFYEAIDFSTDPPGEVVRSWMAHHQGMSLLALCNVLHEDPLRKYFHREPQVLATELLLHERVPRTVVPEPEEAGWAVPMSMPSEVRS